MRVFRLTRLSARERHVIGLLRGADPPFLGTALPPLFKQLRTIAALIGFRPSLPGSISVTEQELCVLGCLAALQRERPETLVEIDEAIRASALICARGLNSAGLHLNHAAITRLSVIPEACEALHVSLVLRPWG